MMNVLNALTSAVANIVTTGEGLSLINNGGMPFLGGGATGGGKPSFAPIMQRAFDMFNFRPTISNIDSEKYTAGRMLSLENLTVNINEATLSQDADYEEVAARVGQALVKELAKEGLTTANYSL